MQKIEQVIVGTKLMPPVSHRRKLIRRQRLAPLLSNSEIPKLTIVTAPAGFGKTSLLFQWYEIRHKQGHVAAWVSLDTQDVSPTRFLRHLIAAIKTEHESFGEAALRYLDTARNPDIKIPLGHLINEITDFGRTVVIFLDDYHLVNNSKIDDFLDYLLSFASPNLHLVISSRLLPGLSLSDLRLRDELLELDARSLQFDKAETLSFLSLAFGKELDPAAIEFLYERSEGWVAGLQLAVAALKDQNKVNELKVSFTGTLRDIADYLAKAVLENQTDEIQTFLLQTSVLERFNADLSLYMTGNLQSQEIIEWLERANLFVVPLDHSRRWFRYHHLFQEFLQGELRRARPSEVVPLYRKAANWFMDNSLGSEAVEYSLHAGDTAQAAHMAEKHAFSQVVLGYLPETLRWLTNLPKILQDENPALLSLETLCFWHIFQQEEASQTLTRFEKQLSGKDNSISPDRCANLNNDILLHRSGIDVCASRDPNRVLAELEAVNQDHLSDFFCAIYHNVRGIALCELNQFDDALNSYHNAARLHRSIGSPLGVACAYYLEALMHLECGNLNMIDKLLTKVRKEPVFNKQSARYIYPSMLDCVEGILCYERGECEKAQFLLESNINLAVEVGHLKMVSLVQVTFAKLLHSQGKTKKAIQQLDHLADHLKRNEPDSPRAMILADYERVKFALVAGRLIDAQKIADDYGLKLNGPAPKLFGKWDRLTCLGALAWCRGQLVTQSPDNAIDIVQTVARLARQVGRKRRYLEARLLEAIAHDMLGDEYKALDVLKPALRTASEDGMLRLVMDEGPQIQKMTRRLQQHGDIIDIDLKFIQKICEEKDFEPSASHTPDKLNVHKDAALELSDFSAKECSILELVALGKSNVMISERLGITIHTVKWHLSNIFTKLQVKNRAAAVSAAKAIRLI